MDEKYIKSVLEGLKSSSSAKVQETLLRIRNKIIINDTGIKLFRECGGLEYLVPHLRKPNERILDTTLSILGNCCLEEECSLMVGKLHTFGPLISILNTVCRDSIVGRACRVIGNLAQRTLNAEALHNHGGVTALITLIENRDKNMSYATLTMAVRAIRQLWMIAEKREEMLSLHAVRCVAILLTTECESAGLIKSSNPVKDIEMKKSQEELISGILKCIGYFTTHATVMCAEQIQGDGRGYQCLVSLTKIFETLALKCLMNLCYLSVCRPLLGTAGIIECLVGILQKISDVSWWPEGAARALSQLSGESVNRSRLRHCGGLPLLMAAARANPCCLHALLQYVFDDTSFQILLNEGLISLLTEELTNHVATMEFEHNYTENTEMPADNNEKFYINSPKNVPKCDQSKAKSCNTDIKGSLFYRRKGPLSNNNEDELKVVIERDNMIVGFVDAVDSDATEDSQSDDDTPQLRRKCFKRARSRSPIGQNKKSHQLIKMVSKDWSAGVYWEPKSPEWPSTCQPSGFRSSMSPDRADLGPLSPYSDGSQSGFSPEYNRSLSSKRPKWDWSPESDADGSSTSPHWTDYQWSPSSSSSSPISPLSNNEDSSDSEISGRYSPVCSENEDEAVDLATNSNTTTELDTAQVVHDLDELIMEDDGRVDEETPLEEEANKADSNSNSSRIVNLRVGARSK